MAVGTRIPGEGGVCVGGGWGWGWGVAERASSHLRAFLLLCFFFGFSIINISSNLSVLPDPPVFSPPPPKKRKKKKN